jgi:aminoglycoside phosphotransferase (APT) family kinase protein
MQGVDGGAVAARFSRELGATVEVTSFRQTFPGQSQETWLVDTTVDGRARGFVLRVNPPGGGIVPLPLRREWEVYSRLAPTHIPVGTPLWYGEDEDFVGGRPYFVRDLVEGSTEVPGLHEPGPAGDELRRQVALEHASHLARVHTLDWAACGLDEVLTAPARRQDAVRLEFDTWTGIWDEVKPEPLPEVTRMLRWYEDRLPADVPRVSLVKGNNGLGEEIWRDGRIVALSDWELAALGDPASDWAFSQGLLSLWDRDEVLAHYEAETGFAIPEGNLDFWTVWILFKSLCCTTAGLRGFLDGRDQRVVLPTIGFGTVHLALQFLAVVTSMELHDAAQMVAAMSARQLDEPAAGGQGRT